ncbi:unnamed protein product [Timema podura]|uniref:Uncharacterized protein n=1 Tax=Timema podura TaxID=61482 RepID=A0ABN7NQK2_TIMPD|nr:unnamed protein product [Timema podura]
MFLVRGEFGRMDQRRILAFPGTCLYSYRCSVNSKSLGRSGRTAGSERVSRAQPALLIGTSPPLPHVKCISTVSVVVVVLDLWQGMESWLEDHSVADVIFCCFTGDRPFRAVYSRLMQFSSKLTATLSSAGSQNLCWVAHSGSLSPILHVENSRDVIPESLEPLFSREEVSWTSSLATPFSQHVSWTDLNTEEKRVLLPSDGNNPRALFSPDLDNTTGCHPFDTDSDTSWKKTPVLSTASHSTTKLHSKVNLKAHNRSSTKGILGNRDSRSALDSMDIDTTMNKSNISSIHMAQDFFHDLSFNTLDEIFQTTEMLATTCNSKEQFETTNQNINIMNQHSHLAKEKLSPLLNTDHKTFFNKTSTPLHPLTRLDDTHKVNGKTVTTLLGKAVNISPEQNWDMTVKIGHNSNSSCLKTKKLCTIERVPTELESPRRSEEQELLCMRVKSIKALSNKPRQFLYVPHTETNTNILVSDGKLRLEDVLKEAQILEDSDIAEMNQNIGKSSSWRKKLQAIESTQSFLPFNSLFNLPNDATPLESKSKINRHKVEVSGDDLLKTKHIALNSNPQMFGFSTASGLKLSVSEEALQKAKNMFIEDDKPKTKPDIFGFSTASGLKVSVSEEALQKLEDDKPKTKPDMFGFSTASGLKMSLSQEVFESMAALIEDEEAAGPSWAACYVSCPDVVNDRCEAPKAILCSDTGAVDPPSPVLGRFDRFSSRRHQESKRSEILPQFWIGPIGRDVVATLVTALSLILTSVWYEMDYRLDVCHICKGGHIEHFVKSSGRPLGGNLDTLTFPTHQAGNQLSRPYSKHVGFGPDQSPVSCLHLTWFPLGFNPTSTRVLRSQGTLLGDEIRIN